MKEYGFIYITTNMANGKRYIGQRKFTQGWKNYLGSGTILKEAIKKYKRKNFKRDIVAIAYNKKELDFLEKEFIKVHKATSDRNYYNICEGGSGVIIKEKPNPNSKKVVCLNNKTIYSSLASASKCFNITCSSISNCCSGRNLSGGKENGIPLVWSYVEDFKKLSDKEIENKIKLALNSKKLNNNYNSKKIICVTTKKLFNSITEGANYYNCSRSHLSSCCNHKRKHCGETKNRIKLQWMFYEEYINLSKDELNKMIIKNETKSIPNRIYKGKTVKCVTTGKIFDSAKKAGEFYKVDPSSILKCCKGQQKHTKKLLWQFC